MDRTSWIGVIVCLILLVGWTMWSTKQAAEQAKEAERIAAEEALKAPAETESPAEDLAAAFSQSPAENPPAMAEAIEESVIVLESAEARFHLTNRGAGIKGVELKDQARTLDSEDFITINKDAKHAIATLSTGPGKFDNSSWSVSAQSDTSVTFQSTNASGFTFSKTFTLPSAGSDPHEIEMELSIRNNAETPLTLTDQFLYTGSAAPLHLNEFSMQIGAFWFNDGKKFEYETVDHFGGRKILGIFGKDEIPDDEFHSKSLSWAGVNDQFFVTLIRPEEANPAKIWASRFPIVVEDNPSESERKRMFAIEAGMGLPEITMNPGDQRTLKYDLYLGPKEYARLKGLGHEEQAVMHYDEIPILGFLFGWAIKPLASGLIIALVYVKGIVGSYGWAIIIVTILIRLLIWPVYAKSARSMKRMSKLAPMMKEIKEKYEDNPQKMNEETMKLYKTYNINPLGGCLPMFIQLPIFLAFYRMLWSATELRHESFLWVKDLSMPDTLFEMPFSLPILGADFNLLPILMAVTSFIQIAITPKTGDKTQQMIFMLMPFMFLFFCYNFASALALYWTTSNVFSIFQTWIMNKLPEPELKKKAPSGKKSFLERMQEQAEAAQQAREQGTAQGGGVTKKDRTRMPGEKGERHTKGKKRRK